MLCYKDMTFCVAKCSTHDCHRQITLDVEEFSTELGLPLSQSDFSEDCPAYNPNETEA